MNPNITWEIILENPDKPWEWYWLSRHPSVTWEIVQENPDKSWNGTMLSMNPNMTWEVVQKNPDIPCNWYAVSMNPKLCWDTVQGNPDKPWDWRGLSRNPFTLEKQRFIDRAARTIQMWWLKILLSPTHPVGRKRLEREYDMYMDECNRLLNVEHLKTIHRSM